MKETWRWFGPSDPVPLAHIRQAGATGIVTALHHIPSGTVWPIDEIQKRKNEIQAAGLEWSVVESLPVSEEIKTQTGHRQQHLDAYRQSLRNIGNCGIRTVCYNFMPVLDWTRTDLEYEMPDGSRALRFDADAFAAFDLFILNRAAAQGDWHPDQIQRAEGLDRQMSMQEKTTLCGSIIKGLPGSRQHGSYSLDMLRSELDRYRDISAERLFSHLTAFVRAVIDAAIEAGVSLCIHPDDPPFPLLGLPRILSTAADVHRLFTAVDTPANGLTFCTGSFGVRPDNDLRAMVRSFGQRIHFIHLRSTTRETNHPPEKRGHKPFPPEKAYDPFFGPSSFHEADHLDGDVDMVAVIRELLQAENGRAPIPMRPDHGHQMLDDLAKTTNPGYSAIGRLRGLAELRGVARALSSRSA